MVFLTNNFRFFFEHDLMHEGSNLSPNRRIFQIGAKCQTGVIDMCKVPYGLAEPSPILRFIFLEKVVLAAHEHHIQRSHRDALSIFVRTVFSLFL